MWAVELKKGINSWFWAEDFLHALVKLSLYHYAKGYASIVASIKKQ
jgi:hypothetical protein